MPHRYRAVTIVLATCTFSMAVLACSALTRLPDPFATASPTATVTFTPTITPSPTATFTPTPTPVPTGMAIRKVWDGSSRFLDYDGGYTIDIPAEWVAIQADVEDIQRALEKNGANDRGVQASIEAVRQAEPGTFRIVGFSKRPTSSADKFVTNFNITMFRGKIAAQWPLDMIVGRDVDEMRSLSPGMKPRQLETITNTRGLQIAGTEVRMSLNYRGGVRLSLYQRQVYFQTHNALVVISFAASADQEQSLIPSVDQLVEGIQLMEP